jgi:hypothetical protein
VYYPDGEFFDPTEQETIAHWLANKMLKSAPVEWQENSWLQKHLKRYQYIQRYKVHDYGMAGFVKLLADEVGASAYTCEAGMVDPKTLGSRTGHRVSRMFFMPPESWLSQRLDESWRVRIIL